MFESQQSAKLALEDGTLFEGFAFGARGTTTGEVVFNTSMTGYQEIMTDPSYCGQIVTMTYPEIGNYGVNEEDIESARPHLAGFVIRNPSPIASNFRSRGTLDQFLERHGVIGISGVDTRRLVRHIRQKGAMRGIISTEVMEAEALVERANQAESMEGLDLVRRVLPEQPINWEEQLSDWWSLRGERQRVTRTNPDLHLVALDFGMKRNIARHLYNQGCRVTIVPGTATAEQIMELAPDGIFLSNGPGDPEPLDYAIETIRSLLGQAPIFGICLGHQLFALACGAKTFKLKFGHRGANQPVLNLTTGRVEITSQNHGFAVDAETLPEPLEITHKNLNDDTVAGLRHRQLPAFSVQYHPEASAGPHDSQYLFGQFMEMVEAQLA